MLKPNKSRNGNQSRITADLTSSQLVLAICVFLCAALICFAMGVIVGKYDERNNNRERESRLSSTATPQPAKEITLPTTKPDLKPGAGAGPVQGVQTSPKLPGPAAMPGYPESPPRTADAKTADAVDAKPVDTKPVDAKPAEVKLAEVKPVDAKPAEVKPVEAHPAPAAEVVAADKKESAGTAELEAVVSAPKPEPGVAPPALEPVAAVAPKTAAKTEAPPAAEPVKPAAAKTGLYTVQLAALSSANRKQQALDMKKKLEGEGITAELLISKDGARVSVVTGSYPDRETAQAACNDLRKSKGYSDCFVRTR